MEFQYKTIANPKDEKLTEKNSRFLSYAFPCSTEDEAKHLIRQIRDSHPKANHHCYAYRLGVDGELYRTNDDGEPSGTAGKPILGQIDSFELTNVLVVVVRYFGGVKLGVSGLIKAYKGSAKLVLENSTFIIKEVEIIRKTFIPYAQVNNFHSWINQFEFAEIIDEEFSNQGGIFKIKIPKSSQVQFDLEIEQFTETE